jgi:hypothetical protein
MKYFRIGSIGWVVLHAVGIISVLLIGSIMKF